MTSTTSTARWWRRPSTPVLAFLVVAGHATVSSAVALAVGADSTAPAVLATVVVVVLLLPARALLLRFLGRRLHPRRARGVAAVQALVTDVHDGSREPEELESVLREAMRDPALRVGYRWPGSADFVDVAGTPFLERVSRSASGRNEIGLIVAGPGRAPVPEEVAREAALVAESTRLRGELGHALGEVEASRQRLLRAGYEERRRLGWTCTTAPSSVWCPSA